MELTLGIDTRVTLLVTGLIFLSALLLGVWKYHGIRTSAEGAAHIYVDIAHRAALLYSFAGILLAVFTELSAWPTIVNLTADLVILAFFVGAIASYVLPGMRRDTTNQFEGQIPAALRLSMYGLMAGEILGFLVLFSGFLVGQF
ncbi:hypothetical protein [Nocardia rhizosphaerihabitans]|uniref:Integral membrane protein n=1 Tax=Nocardia rhizosphaerihabitans TaxID=1691570 RepID=A0ABQ2KKW4_9NOCA|nr:hypothetical protein [Nocardia rhizosphaerihabitans]GGN86244.1 hypothetical protein GCM10011610_41310 [Nocardia rhizosphaerihabitans]